MNCFSPDVLIGFVIVTGFVALVVSTLLIVLPRSRPKQ